MGKKINLLFAVLISVSGCSSDIPVLMKVSNAKNLRGEVSSTLIEGGEFKVQNAENLSCSGKYNESERSLLVINMNCSDDRFGKAVIVRDEKGNNGRGNGTLSDGSKFTLVFGDGIIK